MLPCVIFLPSLQYYFSCPLYQALLSKSMSLPQGTLYWNCWSYRTFALMEVSPQSYKEWQHYSYRGTNMYHPMLFVFGKAISITIGCPVKTAVHDCSLASTYSFRINMPQILYFHKENAFRQIQSWDVLFHFFSHCSKQIFSWNHFFVQQLLISYCYLKTKIKKLPYCVNSYTK